MLSFTYAETRELPAILSDFTQKTLKISNCQMSSGSIDKAEIGINVDNPMSVQMRVSFKYLDIATGKYVDQPIKQYCYIGPHLSVPCKFKVPISAGGKGNGTLSNVELLRLTGENPQGDGKNVYVKSFWFDIEHEESYSEINALNKIREAEEMIYDVDAEIPCFENVCCGMGGSTEKIEQAKIEISKGKEQVRFCNTTEAYALGSSAYTKAKEAQSFMGSNKMPCTDTLLLYKEAKKKVEDAEDYLASLECDPDEEVMGHLNSARRKLNNAKAKISTDEYELAKLEMEGAESAAGLVSAAKCESTNGHTNGEVTIGDGNKTTGGNGDVEDGGTSVCPIGLLPVLLVAFAYMKKR